MILPRQELNTNRQRLPIYRATFACIRIEKVVLLCLIGMLSEVILTIVQTQITFTQQLRMQAAKSLADTYALREMCLWRGKQSNQVCTTGTDIVDRKRLQTGRATNLYDFTNLFLKINKGPVAVTDKGADDQQPFARLALQLEGQSRLTLEVGLVREDRMAIRTVTFLDYLLFFQALLCDHLAFLRLVPAQ